MIKKNLLYAQSGGVTPVINATACGLIEEARQNNDQLGKVYAGKDGIIGILNEQLIDTSKERKADIAALAPYTRRRIWFMSIQAQGFRREPCTI